MLSDNAALAHRFIQALAEGATGQRLAAFLHDDVIQEELPNLMAPGGASRGRAGLLAGAEAGQRLMASQRWQILSTVAEGDQVALEVDWRATLAVPLGALPAGQELHAHLAVFLELRDGRIYRQRNYDCYAAPAPSS